MQTENLTLDRLLSFLGEIKKDHGGKLTVRVGTNVGDSHRELQPELRILFMYRSDNGALPPPVISVIEEPPESSWLDPKKILIL